MYEMKDNSLYYGDCLDFMKDWPNNSVDLIYLDPPFNSNENYNINFGQGNGIPAQVQAFTDTWKWDEVAASRFTHIRNAIAHPLHNVITGLNQILGNGSMLAYLTYMGERLLEMHRLLKTSGSLYLHCDPNASHYLKVLLDGIFGEENFRNEIVWRIGWVSGFKTRKRGWIRNHDIILYYLMSSEGAKRFNKEYIPYAEDYVRRDGSKPTGRGIPIEDTWNCSEADKLDSIMIKSFAKKLGFSTEKPLPLLERIIKASSNLGDLVLDPFCGSGTTVAAANNLGRRWLGIDISAAAIDLTDERRLQPMGIRAETFGIPRDLASARKLAAEKPFDFEGWAVSRIPGLAPNERKVGDEGIDGLGKLLTDEDHLPSKIVVAQVKGGKAFQLGQFRDFLHVLERENAACGIYITLERVRSRSARAEAIAKGDIQVGARRYPRVQLWSIQEYFERRFPELPTLADPFTGKPIQPSLWSKQI